MNLSRIGFLSIFKSHVQKTKTGLWDRLECSGNHPVVYYLIKLEYLLTSYIRVCSVNKPAKTTLSHIRVTIIGKEEGRRHLEGKKKTKKNPNKQKKKKLTSVTIFLFLYLDVTIGDHIWGQSPSTVCKTCDQEREDRSKILNILQMA